MNKKELKAEFKEELRREEMQQQREEPMYDWIKENQTDLEIEFIASFPAEDQPLDDDTPDFMDTYCDEFDEFCRNEFHEYGRLG